MFETEFLMESLKGHGSNCIIFYQELLERLKNATQIEKKNHYFRNNMGRIVVYAIQFLKYISNRK